jgi:hypothetical protein
VLESYEGKIANGEVHDLLENKASFFDCPFRQECSGHVKGLGFAYSCSTSFDDVDYGLQRLTSPDVDNQYGLWSIQFDTAWANNTKPYANVELYMGYVNSHAGTAKGSCPGTMTQHLCEIRPAIVQYPVTMMVPSEEQLNGGNIVTQVKFSEKEAQSINVPLDNIEQIDGIEVLEYVDLVEGFNETSTVSALTYVMNALYYSYSYLYFDQGWGINSTGASASSTFYADADESDEERCWCDIVRKSRDDPTVEILQKLNTLSFVTGLYLNGAPTTNVSERAAAGMASQEFEAQVTGIVEEYLTDFSYVCGALAATFITVMLVLPVYWGFW